MDENSQGKNQEEQNNINKEEERVKITEQELIKKMLGEMQKDANLES